MDMATITTTKSRTHSISIPVSPSIPQYISHSTAPSTSTTPILSSPPALASSAPTPAAQRKPDRPCDACRRRKSRCVIHEGQNECVLCHFHKQECTFVQSPIPRKRRLAPGSTKTDEDDCRADKKRSTEPENNSSEPQAAGGVVQEGSQIKGQPLLKPTLGLQKFRHAILIGPTSEYEESLISLCPLNEKDEYLLQHGGSYRRVNDGTTFMVHPDIALPDSSAILDTIEKIVAPHGKDLIKLYFSVVHPSYPILQKKVFLEKYTQSYRAFPPPLLASVYALACTWWSYSPELSSKEKPDVQALEHIALRTLQDMIPRPKLSTVQAGLLLLQRQISGSWALTAQMVAVGQELGLHLDPTGWKIPGWEKGLRKRLAWALFMQDKWAALTFGRPSHVSSANWAVPPVTLSDFPDVPSEGEEIDGAAEAEKGRQLFEQSIALTQIMSSILTTFFTSPPPSALSVLLELAKPLQIRLRDWYSRLPAALRMDTPSKPHSLNSTGHLHLAYFSTEITLHRILLRSTTSTVPSPSPHLTSIIRSAAKTRLISSLDFMNRLTPSHLQSFWPSHSRGSFALVATFGALLWSTSASIAEGEFYLARLREYRWTLRVSLRAYEGLSHALGVLEDILCESKISRWRELVESKGGSNKALESELGVGLVGFGGDSFSSSSYSFGAAAPPPPSNMGISSSGGAMSGMEQSINEMEMFEDEDDGEEEYGDDCSEETHPEVYPPGDYDADGDIDIENTDGGVNERRPPGGSYLLMPSGNNSGGEM